MSKNITPKQEKVLKLIYNNLVNSDFPPTLQEIKEEMGVVSNQSALNFLDALEKKGCVKRLEGQTRGIRLLPLAFKILNVDLIVPVVGLSSAGPFMETLDDTFEKWEVLPGEITDVSQTNEDVFVIRVKGDSMINAEIYDGDVLLVKKTEQFLSGDIVVARSNDGTTIKRFMADEKRSYLKPENPNFFPKEIPIYPETIFEGKVIANLSAVNRKKINC